MVQNTQSWRETDNWESLFRLVDIRTLNTIGRWVWSEKWTGRNIKAFGIIGKRRGGFQSFKSFQLAR